MEEKRHKHKNLSDKYRCNIECIGIFLCRKVHGHGFLVRIVGIKRQL